MSHATELPAAKDQFPTCGACGCETSFEECEFVCYDCGLAFETDHLDASYLELDKEPCGEPCHNTWHADNAINPGIGYDCGTCLLPKGHVSDHWTGCGIKRLEVRR